MPNGEADYLCDVNVMVALVHDAHEHSEAANRWLATTRHRGAVRICRISQLGFLRLITSQRIFARYALTPVEAWHAYDSMMGDDRLAYLEEPKGVETILRELSATLQSGASIGTDVYLAAFARAAKLAIVSFDSGFRRFPGLSLRLLEYAAK